MNLTLALFCLAAIGCAPIRETTYEAEFDPPRTYIDSEGALQWDFEHNGFGETTSRSGHNAIWSYQWNAAGRLTQASRTGAARPDTPLATSLFADGFEPFETITTTETYVYDAHGHRTRSSRSDGSTRYQVYSRAGQLLYVEDTKDNQRIDYIHLGGKLIAQRSRPLNTSTATTTYHHTDHIQSATIETNTAGTQTQRTVRTPYGSPYNGIYREGPGYAGHVTDTQTNLTYMQQRYYDPVALRFLSPDPVDVSASDGGNFNRYWYANNNPYRYVDPDGRDPVTFALMYANRVTSSGNPAMRLGSDAVSVLCACDADYVAPSGSGALQEVSTPFEFMAAGASVRGVRAGAQALSGLLRTTGTAEATQQLVGNFGKNANQIKHAFRHTDKLGLSRNSVQNAIQDHLPSVANKIPEGGPLNQIIQVEGTSIRYTVFRLPDGTINVGRIHGVP